MLAIREARPADARAILDYNEGIARESDFLSFGPGEYDRTETEEAEALRGYRTADNRLYVLGEVDGEIAGALFFNGGHRPRLAHCGELGMSVREAYWRLGIGSLMLAALIRWAGASPIVTKLNLRVRTDNHAAIRLYERHGFVREGTMKRELRIGDAYYDFHWMGLEV